MTDESNGKGDDKGKLLYCSFCGKSQHEVKKLIAGPSVFICDECVDLCNDIRSAGGPRGSPFRPIANTQRNQRNTW